MKEEKNIGRLADVANQFFTHPNFPYILRTIKNSKTFLTISSESVNLFSELIQFVVYGFQLTELLMNNNLPPDMIDREYMMGTLPLPLEGIHLNSILLHAHKFNASDIVFKTNGAIRAMIQGKMRTITTRMLNKDELEKLVTHIYEDSSGLAILGRKEDIDKMYVINDDENHLRYRVNITNCSAGGREMGHVITMRTIPVLPPMLNKDLIPEEVYSQWYHTNGLALVTGPTGSGKSTLIASINHNLMLNPDFRFNNMSAEAPIEFSFEGVPNLYSSFVQTEVPTMSPSFQAFMRGALRRAPNQIFVGELRDVETMEMALQAGATGHFVYGTVHTTSVAQTLKRIADMFPGDMRQSIINDMVASLRIILTQRLALTTDGKRAPIIEYLVFDNHIRDELSGPPIDGITAKLQEIVNEKGVPFITHARQRMFEGLITERQFQFDYMNNTSMTLEEVDNRIRELKEKGNVMFQNNDL